jgi:hypothetical protein
MRFLRFAMLSSSSLSFITGIFMIVLYFFSVKNYFPLYFIAHANQFRVISRAMKLRADESKNVLSTGDRRTVSFPVRSCERDAIRKIPGKGERFFLLQNLQKSFFTMKTTDALISKFILARKSTCFGQFLCITGASAECTVENS